MRLTTISLGAFLAIAPPAIADEAQCDANPLYVLTGPASIPLGGSDLLEFNTQHTIATLLFVSLGPGPSSTPYGVFCLDFPVPLVWFFITDPSGYFGITIRVPDNPKLDCLDIFMQFAVCNLEDPTQRGISNHIKIELGGTCVEQCPDTAFDDQYAQNEGGHALYLPGLGTQYRFMDDTGRFTEHVELGTGLLSGIVENDGEPGNKWDVHVEFSGRVDPADAGFPPPGSPYRQLDPSAYIENGGPVDTSGWYYYVVTSGVLTGLENNAGATVIFGNIGPAYQVGFGASGKNVDYGASGWFAGIYTDPTGQDYSVAGDINIDLKDCELP